MRLLTVLLLVFAVSTATAAPSSNVLEHFKQHDKGSEKTIDHSAWTAFLQEYVVEGGPADLNRVRYGEVSKTGQKALQQYIQKLQAINITKYNLDEQRAFWLNLHNAVLVNLVVQHYPIENIRQLGEDGPWYAKRVAVDGVALSLHDIEYRILHPIWHDELNIYGLNKATVGSPNLLTKAFTGKNVWLMLRQNAFDFVESRRGARYDEAGRLSVSLVYRQHMDAFGGIETGIITHLRKYAQPAFSLRLDATSNIADYFYDRSLNDME